MIKVSYYDDSYQLTQKKETESSCFPFPRRFMLDLLLLINIDATVLLMRKLRIPIYQLDLATNPNQ